MAGRQPEKVPLVCPHCGHRQLEPRRAISTLCRRCGQYLRVQELLHPTRRPAEQPLELKRVTCFVCGATLEVPAAAQSAMCKRCSSHIDLQDYVINNAVSKNFKTRGRFVVETKGYVFNTQVNAREVVLKGRFLGRIEAQQSLTVYSTGDLKGSVHAPLLIIPPGNCFHWKDSLDVAAVEVLGEVTGDVRAAATVLVRSTGRLFGSVRAENLVVEEGAVLVGQARIGAGKAHGI